MRTRATYISKAMRQSLALLLLLLSASCWGPTSKDRPSDEEAIEHFKEHELQFEQLKDLVYSTRDPKSDPAIQRLLKEADCKSIQLGLSKQIVISYFSGGTILAASSLDYIYMDPFCKEYGDSIAPSQDLQEEVYKSPLRKEKVKPIGAGWYLRLSVD